MKTWAKALAFLAAFLPTVAAAQVPNYTLPPSTVVGRSALGPGPAQAIPFSQIVAVLLNSNPLSIPSVSTNSVVFKGSTSGQAILQAQAAAGTPTINLPTASGTLADSATSPLVLNAATGALSCPTCAINGGLFSASTRTAAAALNLSSYGVVRTGGYSVAGDGGAASFKNVGTSPFADSQVATGSLTVNGTSGCTTGTYAGVSPSGGTGHGLQITYVVSGGVVTSAAIVGNGGNAYSVGDVVTTTIAGCAASVTYTIATITSPTCSFTDTSGAHFQMIVDVTGVINIKQCGAAVNWNSTAGDAGSTNDTTAIQNALNFAGNTVQPTVDGGGVAGQTVLVPFGNTLSGALTVPFGVKFTGINAWSSQIKFTDAMGAAVIPLTLCDSTTHLACFGTQLANMTLRGGSGTANSNVPMVFSNSVQQMNALWRVAFYPQQRGCVQYDSGFGGAAQVGFVEVECTMSSLGSPGFNFTNIGSTLVYLKNANSEFGGSGVTGNGVQALGGFIDIDNFHTEGVSNGIFWNNTGSTSTGAIRIHNVSGGAHCTNLVVRQTGSVSSDMIVGMAVPNGCTNTVNNGGTGTTTPVIADTLY